MNMKRVFLALAAVVLMATTSMAQSSYFEANFGFTNEDNTFTKTVFGKEINYDFSSQVKNITIGYNVAITSNMYFGATLGYSMVGSDNEDSEVNLFTLTPKLTYQYRLGGGFYWTPNVYLTAGYGIHDLGEILGQDAGQINYLNFRIGLNVLSFDFRLNKQFAINLTALTPYYNIMNASYSDENFENSTEADSYNGFQYVGGTIGVKFSL